LIGREPSNGVSGFLRGRGGIGLTLVGAILVLTLVSFFFVFDAERDRERQERDVLQSRAAGAVRTSTARLVAGLSGASALVDPDGALDKSAFDAFAREQLAGPLSALAFERIVSHRGRAAFEESIGRPIIVIAAGSRSVAPRRATYFAVEAVFPQTRSTRAVIGYDIASSAVRKSAAMGARDAGRARLSAPIELTGSGRPGILVVAPVYMRDQPRRTVAERRRAAIGFISSGFDIRALEREIARQFPASVVVRVADGSNVIIGPASLPGGRTIQVAGRTWTIGAVDRAAAGTGTAWMLLVAGLVLTVLASLLLVQTVRRELSLIRSREDLRRARDAVLGLQRLTSAIAQAMVPDEIAGAISRFGLPLVGASGFALFSREKATMTLRLVSAEGPGAEAEPAVLHEDDPVLLAEAVRTRSPVWMNAALGGYVASAALPLLNSGEIVGALRFGYAVPQGFDDEQRARVESVAAQCARAFERASVAEAEHELARSLQESLLPHHLPAVEGLEIAARYEPAAQFIDLGGDWFDAIELGDGRIGLVVGDVVGHGAPAAAIMGQLRSALRAFATDNGAPKEVMRKLSEFSERIEGAEGTTVTYGVLDPVDGSFVYCAAGHPPPLHVGANAARYLDGGRSLPLGVGERTYVGGATEVADGEAILLFSDGAVEQRGRALEVGLARLAAFASEIGPDAESLTSVLLERLELVHEDDIAMLAVTRRVSQPPRQEFVSEARRRGAGSRGRLSRAGVVPGSGGGDVRG
jgi:serine phosphatase RsbU (regulator of sigma subunit)/CHASE1-domain containing sensor protein